MQQKRLERLQNWGNWLCHAGVGILVLSMILSAIGIFFFPRSENIPIKPSTAHLVLGIGVVTSSLGAIILVIKIFLEPAEKWRKRAP